MKSFILRQFGVLLLGLIVWFGGNALASYYTERYIYAPQGGIVIVDPVAAHINDRENGSSVYPFSTIGAGLDYARARNHSETQNITLLVAPGTYAELLNVPQNTSLLSANTRENVNIIPPEHTNGGGDLITLHNNTTLYNLTTTGGDHGIVIIPRSSTHIAHVSATDARIYNIFMDRLENNYDDQYEPIPEKVPNETPAQKNARTAAWDARFDFDTTLTPDDTMNIDGLMQNFDPSKKVIMSHIYAARSGKQNIYLKEGWVEIRNALIEQSGQEGIDLHARMYVTIDDSLVRNNAESGLEAKIDRVFITIRNTVFENNTSNGLNMQTDAGLGKIILDNVVSKGNTKFGLRCALHKKRPSHPKPFFPTIIDSEGLTLENNLLGIDKNCRR